MEKEDFHGKGNLKVPEQEKIHELEKRLKDAELERDILQKSNRHFFFQERSMIYSFIKNNDKVFPIEKMCKVIQVSSGSYYQWKKQIITERQQHKIVIKEQIILIYFESKQRHGSPRITLEL